MAGRQLFFPPLESQPEPGLQPCGPNIPKPIPVVKWKETSDWPDLSQLSIFFFFFWSFLVAPSKLCEPRMRKQTEMSVFKEGSSAYRRDESNRPSGQESSPVFAGSYWPTSWSLGRLCHWDGCPVACFSPQSLLARVLVKILTVLNSRLMDLLRNRAAAVFITSALICVYSFSRY